MTDANDGAVVVVDAAARARLRAALETPGALRVRAAFAAAGVPLRLVGGSVRDALSGLPVKDVDLCTPAPPDRTAAILTARNVRVVPTGIEHGTLTAVADGLPFEITTLRRDVRTDGRRAVVAFTDDWREDAARRDFTVNAMSTPAGLNETPVPAGMNETPAQAGLNAAGSAGSDDPIVVFDYFGGLADLAAGRIRFVGDAETRLKEDVLRLLRFYRFFARYGVGAPDETALAACRAMAHLLPGLSAERVRAELLRLMEAPAAAVAWRRMAENDGVLEPLGLLPADPDGLQRLIDLQTALNEPPDPLLRLIAACSVGEDGRASEGRGSEGRGAGHETTTERLRLSNAEKARWRALATTPDVPETPGRNCLYRCGSVPAFRDVLRLTAARRGRDAAWVRAAEAAAGDEVPRLPVAGRDLLKIGATPGPQVGDLLKRVENWWVGAGFIPDRAACLNEAARLLKG